MVLLVLCGSTWILLVAALVGGLSLLPTPWGPPEIVMILLLVTAALSFARIGVTSLLCLGLRILPSSRLRTRLARSLLRGTPIVLRSSAVAVLAASLLASPAQASSRTAAGPDPTWPMTSDAPPGAPPPAVPPGIGTEAPPDPTWPTGPVRAGSGSDEAPEHDGVITHTVVAGESLWSIAARRIPADEEFRSAAIDRLVDDIHQRNQDLIGPDPNLIVPGQRLEIHP